MVYTVYTDGGHIQESQLVAAAYMVLTENRFVTHGLKVYTGFSANAAEFIAIGLASEAVLKKCKLRKNDCVRFKTDSLRAVELFNGLLSGEIELDTQNEKIRLAYRLYRDLSEKYDVKIVWMGSHAREWNVNNQADRMASQALRQVALEEIRWR